MELTINVKVDGDDVYVNGDLHTFDGANLTNKTKILMSVAEYLGASRYIISEYTYFDDDN